MLPLVSSVYVMLALYTYLLFSLSPNVFVDPEKISTMQTIMNPLKLSLNTLPRFSLLRIDKNPVFNVRDVTYVQGVFLWSLLPMVALLFWLSLYFLYSCVWCCFHSKRFQINEGGRIRFCRRLALISLIVCHIINCSAVALLVFSSEQLHSSNGKVMASLISLKQNTSKLNSTLYQIDEVCNAYRHSSPQDVSQEGLRAVGIVSSSNMMHCMAQFSAFAKRPAVFFGKFEFIRWISVIIYTVKFCLFTVMMCKCCQFSKSRQYSWSSFAMILQSVSTYLLLSICYLPLLIGLADFCLNPTGSFLNLMNSDSRENCIKVFDHVYKCDQLYFESEIEDLISVVKSVGYHSPKAKSLLLTNLAFLLHDLSTQLSCKIASHVLQDIEYTLCQYQFVYILLCSCALTILCLFLPLSAMLLKSLSYQELMKRDIGRSDINPRRNLPAISSLTVNRIRKALRKNNGLEAASAPPINGNKKRQRQLQQFNKDSSVIPSLYPNTLTELTPMLPPRSYQNPNEHVSPPPYDHSSNNHVKNK
ncbi:hypothetical protein GJ496_005960 [Pomphorhynchus laevis]|nr:hypothetical protein GJ496_005960 [Pomphorhynchus laevis]